MKYNDLYQSKHSNLTTCGYPLNKRSIDNQAYVTKRITWQTVGMYQFTIMG